MPRVPAVSVVVCTRDRAGALARCLAALARQSAPFAHEVWVVDNGSRDGTARVVAEAAARDPSLRYAHESCVGLSHARNRGAREAAAPVLAYLDDDAEPLDGWLAALAGALAESGADVAGGPIEARFESPPPGWLAPAHLGALSCQDLGAERRPVTEFPYLFGANLAVTRAALERAGGFDPGYGRSGTSLLSGEDTALCERVLAAGGSLVWEPAARVLHWIPPERLTRGFFRRRAEATGRTRALQAAERAAGPRLALAAAAKLARLPAHLAAWGASRMIGRHERAAIAERSVFATIGFSKHVLSGGAARARSGAGGASAAGG